MLIFAAAALLALVWTGPETDLRRGLRRLLIERPAEMLLADPLWTLARLLAIFALVGLAMSAPELIGVFGMVDMAVMMEFAMFATLVIGLVQLRGWRDQASQGFKAICRRVAAARSGQRREATRGHVTRPRRDRADNDDGDPLPAWTSLAA